MKATCPRVPSILQWLVACVLALSLLLGCDSPPRPDLHRLYGGNDTGMQPPVILIPGVLGSRLRDRTTGKEVWPGSTWNLLFSTHQELALKFDPVTLETLPDSLEPSGLFEGVLGQDFYGAILRTLEKSGGYVPGTPGQPADPKRRRYYVFAYDWRQDNTLTALKLDALIEQIRHDYQDPKLKVDVIAHSMGGLIARYYLQYGTHDAIDGEDFPLNHEGADKLRTVVLLGTPNLGSVSSLNGFIDGAQYGLRKISPEVLATMPSLYQLFPHPLNDWLVSADGQVLDRDLFDTATWRDLRWSVFDPSMAPSLQHKGVDTDAFQRYFAKHLERARRFIWSLTVEQPDAPVKLVVFGGDCTLTPARLLLEKSGNDWETRLTPDEVQHHVTGVDYEALMFEPGDGLVTKPSLLARQNLNPTEPRNDNIFFPLAYSFFLCEGHSQLTGNLNFQDNLLNVLLTGQHSWDQPQKMSTMPAAARTQEH